ncbi:MAG: L-histidine N(alpha)-methyltransferase, partial [Bacteroidota bacterium]
VSKSSQDVRIESLDLEIRLRPWETIHTEISQKYDDEVVNWLAEQADLKISTSFTDKDALYKNYVLKK